MSDVPLKHSACGKLYTREIFHERYPLLPKIMTNRRYDCGIQGGSFGGTVWTEIGTDGKKLSTDGV